MTRLSDNKVIIDLNKSHIDKMRGNEVGNVVRPNWKAYRLIVEIDSLRADEEQGYFADFSIKNVCRIYLIAQ
ncbi:MAG: hypothetical protein V5789_12515 [Colwellia sp.]